MTTMILAFVLTLLLVAAMAIGVLMGRKPIAGTCGGMKALGMSGDCEICGGNTDLCDSSDEVIDEVSDAANLTTRVGK